MALVEEQIGTGELKLGEMTDPEDLRRNLRGNAIPGGLDAVTAAVYQEFLAQRRTLMAQAIHRHFEGL